MKTKKIVISILTLIVMTFAFAACEKPIAVTKVTVNKAEMSLVVGGAEKLTFSVEPKGADIKSAKWRTADEKIATVKADGTVTAVAVGKVDITISVDELSAICRVTVVPVSTQAEKDAAAFRTAHANILTKKLADVVVADKAAVAAAKVAFDALTAEVKLIVKADGENLDAFAAKIANIEAGNTLSTAKTAAKTALIAYKNTIVYTDGGVARTAAIDAGKKAIDVATTVKGVEEAQAAAQAVIDTITSKLEDDTVAANRVTTIIGMLPAVDVITLTDKAAVAAARVDYNALNAEAKTLVDTVAADKLVACEAKLLKMESDTAAALKVTTDINNLPAAEAIALTDKVAVRAARAAYDALNVEAKALVTVANVDKLIACEAKLIELDSVSATPVIKAIQNLPAVNASSAVNGILPCDKPDVDAALAAYAALTVDGKALVTNYDVLVAANAKLVAIENAEKMDIEIGKIASAAAITTLREGNMPATIIKVESVNAAYGDLDPQTKAFVLPASVAKLTASVKKIADLREADVIEQEIIGIKTAAEITSVGADGKAVVDAVELAKDHYDAMANLDAKKLILSASVTKLNNAVSKIGTLNDTAATKVETLISNIATVTISNMAAEKLDIAAARTAFDALRPEAKNLVAVKGTNNTAKLLKSETEYADCVAAVAVKTAIGEIGAITGLDDLTADKELVDKIAAVEVQFLALSTAGKALLIVDDLNKYDAATAKVVILKIAAIPADGVDATAHAAHVAAVEAVRVAYDKLTLAGQALVTSNVDLYAKEAALLDIDIQAIVDSKGTGDYTIAHAASIGAAQAKFDKLPAGANGKDKVTKKTDLDTAIAAMKTLYKQIITDATVANGKYAPANYESAQQGEITTLKNTANTALDNAATKVLGMQGIIDTFVAAADKVVTKAATAQALEDAKLAAIAKLDTALAVYVEDDYSRNNYADIITHYNTAKAAIKGVTVIGNVTSTTTNAINTFNTAANQIETEAAFNTRIELAKFTTEATATNGKVNGLKENISAITIAEDDPKIKTARASYDAISAGAKALVTNRERLFLSEIRIAELNVLAAKAVDASIVALDKANAWNSTNVTNVATAYNKLTLEAQALVLPANLAKLASYEAEQFTMIVTQKVAPVTPVQGDVTYVRDARKAMTKAGQAAILAPDIAKIDEAEVKLFKTAAAAITNIQTTPTNVDTAENAYNALSATAKPEADSVHRLNTAQAKRTDVLIAGLPTGTSIATGHNTTIANARASYEALCPEAKALVTQLTTLNTAEVKLVAAFIAAANNKKACIDARTLYTALTDAQKTALESETNKIATLETKEAALVIAKITAIPAKADVTYAKKAAVTDARAEFDLLTAGAQAKVSNTAKLTDAEGVIANLEAAAAAVDALIAALPKYSALSNANRQAVTDADTALKEITDANAKALVLNQKALAILVIRLTEFVAD